MSELLQSGNLNEVLLVEGTGNSLLVLRKPQPAVRIEKTMVQVIVEHSFEGFFDNPFSRIGMRSPVEQVVFAQRLKQKNVPTPAVSLNAFGEQVIDYIPDAERLYDLWLNQDQRACYATPKILQAVMIAHEADLVLGDSTGKNELVTPEAEITFIDFDIRLSGPEAREFELANLMYRLSRAAHRGNPKQLPVLGEVYKDILSSERAGIFYDRDILLRYMYRFVELSSEKGAAKLHGMTPITQPEHSAELFSFLIDVLKCSIRQSE